jgi:hypothetical protein
MRLLVQYKVPRGWNFRNNRYSVRTYKVRTGTYPINAYNGTNTRTYRQTVLPVWIASLHARSEAPVQVPVGYDTGRSYEEAMILVGYRCTVFCSLLLLGTGTSSLHIFRMNLFPSARFASQISHHTASSCSLSTGTNGTPTWYSYSVRTGTGSIDCDRRRLTATTGTRFFIINLLTTGSKLSQYLEYPTP